MHWSLRKVEAGIQPPGRQYNGLVYATAKVTEGTEPSQVVYSPQVARVMMIGPGSSITVRATLQRAW